MEAHCVVLEVDVLLGWTSGVEVCEKHDAAEYDDDDDDDTLGTSHNMESTAMWNFKPE